MAKNNKKTQKKNVKEEVLVEKKNKKETTKEEIKEEIVNTPVKKEKIKEEKKGNKVKKKVDFDKVVTTLDNNRWSICLFVVGFLIATLLFRFILWPERIATLSDGTQPVVTFGENVITADDIYTDMRKTYSIDSLLEKLDMEILKSLYEVSDSDKDEAKKTVTQLLNYYTSDGQATEEQVLSYYGFTSVNDMIETVLLNNLRNKYLTDYVKSSINDKDIDKYYKDKVFGDVDSKHILVSIDEEEGLSDKEAKALAEEIISKLNKGASWDEVKNEYSDSIIAEELGYNAFNANLEANYLLECKNLEVGKYSKTPVKTSYGYHVVYKIQQKDKPSLEDIRNTIVDELVKEKTNADSKLLDKSLIKMREDAKVVFNDSKLNDKYNDYKKSVK